MGKDISIALWDKFDAIMSERGFNIIVHDDESLGRGSIAFKDDKFVPLFNLHVWGGPIKENFVLLTHLAGHQEWLICVALCR